MLDFIGNKIETFFEAKAVFPDYFYSIVFWRRGRRRKFDCVREVFSLSVTLSLSLSLSLSDF